MLHTRAVLPQVGKQLGQRQQIRRTKVKAPPCGDLEGVREAQVGPRLGKASQSPVRGHPDYDRLRSRPDPVLHFESLPPQGMERMR